MSAFWRIRIRKRVRSSRIINSPYPTPALVQNFEPGPCTARACCTAARSDCVHAHGNNTPALVICVCYLCPSARVLYVCVGVWV